ncbi:MAG: hypothetical protein JRF31_05255 [Deltaproteobacteria bacterium]|nr:hypothetical protein [Deltaproteobacteria bacterium]MBW2320254.1 hypothetical protein [Deltaproteobacteria bacterium]
MEVLKKEIENIRPTIITNMARGNKEKNAGQIVQIVAEKYLTTQTTDLCSVSHDKQIGAMISDMAPLINLDQSSHAFADIYEIVSKLM